MPLFWVVLSYFIGSIPSGYIIGRLYGVDLRKVGSGNIGATNAYRALGIGPAAAVFICDFMKGVLAVWLGGPNEFIQLLCAVGAIVGNDWSVFLGFKSGKGVACGVGAFTFLFPMATGIAFAVWLLVFLATRIVSLASILAVPVVPLVILFTGRPFSYAAIALLAGAIIIWKHKSNIKRLLSGKEKKISRN
jgi:glycerol-3-phosphate acyltransferase PlsY